MDLRQMVKVATDMRKNHSFMLDISDKEDYEVTFITALVKRDGIYNFFVKIQDMTLDEIYVVCKIVEAQCELKKLNNKRHTEEKRGNVGERCGAAE